MADIDAASHREDYQKAFSNLKYIRPPRNDSLSNEFLCYRVFPLNPSERGRPANPVTSHYQHVHGVFPLPEEPNFASFYMQSPFELQPDIENFLPGVQIPHDMSLYRGRAPPSVQRHLWETHPGLEKFRTPVFRERIRKAGATLVGLDTPFKLYILQFLLHDPQSLVSLSQVSQFWEELTRPLIRKVTIPVLQSQTFRVPTSLPKQIFVDLDRAWTHRTFPQELVDLVIDHISHDRNSLQNCALVNKAWVYRSQFHLFSTIRIDAAHSPRLLCWFFTRNRSFKRFIHDVILSTEAFSDEFIDDALGLVGRCEAVRSLQIVQTSPSTNWAPILQHALADFFISTSKTLRTLIIPNISSFPGLLVGHAASLQHLSWSSGIRPLLHSATLGGPPLLENEEGPSICLRKLTYATDVSSHGLSFPHLNLTTVDSLHLRISTPSYFIFENRCLGQCAATLKHLVLNMVSITSLDPSAPVQTSSPVSLGTLVSLSTLSVVCNWSTRAVSGATWKQPCRTGPIMASLLSTLPTPCLNLTSIRITLCVQDNLLERELHTWAALDDFFSVGSGFNSFEKRIPKLREVVLGICVKCKNVSICKVNRHLAELRSWLVKLERLPLFRIELTDCRLPRVE
ncbi:hypothetical protein DL96DRAFT_702927 [Flagelloscypha sp. PMI_526]|nr:hypothetical protein DL96DRAFT_702927 [Flagelloscypha sp. PMI_526]